MKVTQRIQLYTVLGLVLPILVPVLAVLTGGYARAATNTKEESPKTAVPANGKKTTDMNFEDVLVQGKYHFSDEAVTTVEEDKVLDSLLGVRKDFKDRIRKSVSRQ